MPSAERQGPVRRSLHLRCAWEIPAGSRAVDPGSPESGRQRRRMQPERTHTRSVIIAFLFVRLVLSRGLMPHPFARVVPPESGGGRLLCSADVPGRRWERGSAPQRPAVLGRAPHGVPADSRGALRRSWRTGGRACRWLVGRLISLAGISMRSLRELTEPYNPRSCAQGPCGQRQTGSGRVLRVWRWCRANGRHPSDRGRADPQRVWRTATWGCAEAAAPWGLWRGEGGWCMMGHRSGP